MLREDLLENTRRSVLLLQVCSIIGHLSQPKYNFIWDVLLVLDYLESELPNNGNLPDKLLTFKVAMLLALASAFSVRGLHILDTRFIVETSQKYVFKFHKLHESWRQRQKNNNFRVFSTSSRQGSLSCVSFG